MSDVCVPIGGTGRSGRRALWLAVLAMALLAGCTTAEYRAQFFPGFRALPTREAVDAVVAIEATAAAPGFDSNFTEAFREIMVEDLATLFAKSQTTKDDTTDFLIRAEVSLSGMFPPTSVTVNATMVEPATGAALASSSQTAQDSTFLGETRMRRVADQYVTKVLSGVKADLAKALADPQVFAKRRPRGPNVTGLMAQARTAQDAGDDRAVLAALRRALRANPSGAEPYADAAKLLIRLCDPEGALKLLDEGEKQGAAPDVLRASRETAEQEKAAAIRAALPAACEAQTLHREGMALARAQQAAPAVAKFEAAGKLIPGLLPKADYNAAILLEQLNRPKDALPHYVAAQQAFLSPQEETDALTRLVAMAQRANIAAPDPIDRRYRLGIVRAQQKRYPEAITEFEAALAGAPWLVDAYYNLGLVYDVTGNYADALQAFRNYVALAPNAPNIGTVKTKIVELEDRLSSPAPLPTPVAAPAPPVEKPSEGGGAKKRSPSK